MIRIERVAFAASVLAGIVAAIAGGIGEIVTAIAAGCIAALAPVIGRAISKRIERSAATAFENRIAEAEQRAAFAQAELSALQVRLAPRRVIKQQVDALCGVLAGQPKFSVGVNHNRHEAEPSEYSEQIRAALRQAGFEPGWFGGTTNATIGIEVSGPDSPQKRLFLEALSIAQIDHLNVNFSNDPEGKRSIELWVGTHPLR